MDYAVKYAALGRIDRDVRAGHLIGPEHIIPSIAIRNQPDIQCICLGLQNTTQVRGP